MTVYLKNCVTKIDVDHGKSNRFQFAVANCQGWRVTQEDAHLAMPNFQHHTSLFGVFDGHNGPEVARLVANYFPVFLMKNANYCHGNIERSLSEVFLQIDEYLLSKEANDIMTSYQVTDVNSSGSSKSQLSQKKVPVSMYTGCTAVVLLIKNDIYYCANIGDSRCVVSRDAHAHMLSLDHKPVNIEEKTRVEKAGGFVIHGRINMGIDVSRAFGDHIYKKNAKLGPKDQLLIAWPHITVEVINPKDQFILLICDGIWNAMPNQELVEFVNKRMVDSPLTRICEDAIRAILPTVMPKTGIVGKDNMTIMIIKPTSQMVEPMSGIFAPTSILKMSDPKDKKRRSGDKATTSTSLKKKSNESLACKSRHDETTINRIKSKDLSVSEVKIHKSTTQSKASLRQKSSSVPKY